MIAKTNTMTDDRVRALIEAYGADSSRWPAEERASALARIAEVDELRVALDGAHALDALLNAVPTPSPSPALRMALKDLPDQPRGSNWFGWLGAFAAPWQPAAGLVAAGVLGLWIGVTQPDFPLPALLDASPTAAEADFEDPFDDAAGSAIGAGTGDLLR
ncbi:MAG: hypothetical protein HQ481_12980 [Alphaproteobacteria bacterium]|nr:hypothetical protein [Alphaproteobacteria bacterium]